MKRGSKRDGSISCKGYDSSQQRQLRVRRDDAIGEEVDSKPVKEEVDSEWGPPLAL
jgi:hypothetical protein